MEKPFERIAKSLSGPVIAVLADQKAPIRAAGVQTLTHMAEAAGLDVMLAAIATGLESTNSVQRKELLAWLEATIKSADSKTDLTPITSPLLSCLEDRTPEVRKHAGGILPHLVSTAGYNTVMDATSSLKPASRSTIIPLIDAAKASAVRVSADGKASSTKAAASSITPSAPLSRPPSNVAKPLARPGASIPPSPKAEAGPASKLKTTSSTIPSNTSSKPLPRTPVYPQPPFKSTDNKAKSLRASKEVGPLRWSIEGLPRPEQIEYLYQQAATQMSPHLLELCFSREPEAERDHLSALAEMHACLIGDETMLQKYNIDLENMTARMLANLDLVYKFVSLRMADSGSTTIQKCLNLIQDSFSVLLERGHHLSDYEAGCCIPPLVYQLGNDSASFHSGAKTMLQTLTTVYPASKTFATVFDLGVSSKITRIRAASLEVLRQYIQRHGIRICQPVLLIPALSPSISDRDILVREQAAGICQLLEGLLGASELDAVIATLPASDRAAVHRALGRTEAIPTDETLGTPKAARNTRTGVLTPQANGRTSKDQSQQKPTASSIDAAKSGRAASIDASVPNINSLVRHLSLSEVTSQDHGVSIDALKRLQKAISEQPNELISLADDIITALSSQMRYGFDGLETVGNSSGIRLCKHLMQTLSGFFDNPALGRAVSRDHLVTLLAELTRRLLETSSIDPSEAIASLGKVLNMILIRIFHNSDQSACFGALFILLENVASNLRELKGDELAGRARYAELVLKEGFPSCHCIIIFIENGRLAVSLENVQGDKKQPKGEEN